MSAKDTFHTQVRQALQAEGWVITHDPYRLVIGKRKAYVDLGAEMPIAAEKEGRKIAVEIKSFLGASELDDLEDALGQYGIYRAILELREPERLIYLALPNTTRELLLEEKDFRHILSAFQARLLFYDPLEKEALEWIEPTSFA
jgi:hypothetical protein